jgi:hypothetical protein
MNFLHPPSWEELKHKQELEHLSEDAAVHLDGGEWARLANQRLQRERHPEKDPRRNVLTNSQAVNIVADHKFGETAADHWFSPTPATYQAIDSAASRATELLQSKRLGEVLKDVEETWVPFAEGKVVDEDKEEFWSAASSEYFESRHRTVTNTRLPGLSGTFKRVIKERW